MKKIKLIAATLIIGLMSLTSCDKEGVSTSKSCYDFTQRIDVSPSMTGYPQTNLVGTQCDYTKDDADKFAKDNSSVTYSSGYKITSTVTYKKK
jgi:hypothetical protein